MKWRSQPPSAWRLRGDAVRLQDAVKALRLELAGRGLPERWVRGLLVVRGPGSRGLATRMLQVGGGDRVRVVSSEYLPGWLDGQNTGKLGPDYAETIISDLRRSNAALEEAIDAGPVLRWLARVR